MARLAVDDGVSKTIVTPHQLGSYRQNGVDLIRARTRDLQARLAEADVPLEVLPGADVQAKVGKIKSEVAEIDKTVQERKLWGSVVIGLFVLAGVIFLLVRKAYEEEERS